MYIISELIMKRQDNVTLWVHREEIQVLWINHKVNSGFPPLIDGNYWYSRIRISVNISQYKLVVMTWIIL